MDPLLKKQFNKLPKNIRDFIISDTFKDGIKSITSEHHVLNKDTEIENEIVFILLGLEPLLDLEKNLKNDAELTQEQIQNITSDILEKIITPVKDDLSVFLEKELRDEREGGNKAQETVGETLKKENSPEDIKRVLRENSKTVSVKNLIANIK